MPAQNARTLAAPIALRKPQRATARVLTLEAALVPHLPVGLASLSLPPVMVTSKWSVAASV